MWITTNWKILKEMGILDHLTSLLRNLDTGQEATEPNMEQQTGSKLEYVKKGVCHVCILSPSLFNLYAEYIMQNAGLAESQTRIKIARRINNHRK